MNKRAQHWARMKQSLDDGSLRLPDIKFEFNCSTNPNSQLYPYAGHRELKEGEDFVVRDE